MILVSSTAEVAVLDPVEIGQLFFEVEVLEKHFIAEQLFLGEFFPFGDVLEPVQEVQFHHAQVFFTFL